MFQIDVLRASKNFHKYLDDFIQFGEKVGLPADRLSDSEWRQLNDELKRNTGVVLVPREKNGYLYYWFSSMFQFDVSRASKSFFKYLNDFKQSGVSVGLPAGRLSDSEWRLLNNELKNLNITLIPREKDGMWYYWFSKSAEEIPSKKNVFVNGVNNIYGLLISEIKNKYPNIPEESIIEMIKSRGMNADFIYEKLRYKQNGEYKEVSLDDYRRAFVYAIESCDNKDELYNLAFAHNWAPGDYGWCQNVSLRRKNWPNGRNIKMFGMQNWTWFRECVGNVNQPIKDEKYPLGFHLSLNVNVFDKTLQVLDDILMEDGGKYIISYKFPKVNYYKDITTRHDPITIYMNARNTELEQKIVKAMAPFARSNDGLIGDMLGYGVSIAPETSGNGGASVGQCISEDIAKMISKYREYL